MPNLTGKVKWFDAKKGFGFITPTAGGPDIFVHHKQIEMEGYRQLCEDQEVSYESERNDRGIQAINVRPCSPFVEPTKPHKPKHETTTR